MSHDEFSKLFRYIMEFRKETEAKFELAHQERQEIRASVAELGSQMKDNRLEILALGHKVDRLHTITPKQS